MKLRRFSWATSGILGVVLLLFSSAGGRENEAYALNKPSRYPPGESWHELQQQYRGVFVLYASRDSRKVALTFDDVPDPRFTSEVLDVLKEKKARATFFVVGTRAGKHPELVRRIHAEGHMIGNHSYSHPSFSKLSLSEFSGQIRRAQRAISEIVGFEPRWIRPPYGEIRSGQLKWAKDNGYTIVNWDVDSYDWQQLTADKVFSNVTRTVKPGSVILMHAGGGEGQSLAGTVKALPRIIDWLREKGYEPVTLQEMLGVREYRGEVIPGLEDIPLS